MEFSAILLVLHLLPLARGTIIRFRTPPGDFYTNHSSKVSYLFADIYQPSSPYSFDFKGIANYIASHPCLEMHPAYSQAQNRIVLYGTCNYGQLLRLELNRSGRMWQTWIEQCHPKMSCSRLNLTEFNFSQKESTLTAQGTKHDPQSDHQEVHLLLLLNGSAWNYDQLRSVYPAMNSSAYVLSPPEQDCDCLNGSVLPEARQQEVWDRECAGMTWNGRSMMVRGDSCRSSDSGSRVSLWVVFVALVVGAFV